MVTGISFLLGAYEALALVTGRPTLTRISHTKIGVVVWLWLLSVTVHLIRGEDPSPLPLGRLATVRSVRLRHLPFRRVR